MIWLLLMSGYGLCIMKTGLDNYRLFFTDIDANPAKAIFVNHNSGLDGLGKLSYIDIVCVLYCVRLSFCRDYG